VPRGRWGLADSEGDASVTEGPLGVPKSCLGGGTPGAVWLRRWVHAGGREIQWWSLRTAEGGRQLVVGEENPNTILV
jgi:hypothetical protein